MKSLWELMGQAPPTAPTASDAVDESSVAPSKEHPEGASPSEQPAERVSKGLWEVMGTAAPHALPEQQSAQDAATDEAPAEMHDDEPAEPPQSSSPKRRFGKGAASAVCGGLAIGLSAFSILPDFYSRLPATVAGFAAILLGYLAQSERRRRGRLSLAGASGIAAGTVGLFLGPLVVSDFGRSLRQRAGRELTHANLETLGNALHQYHDERGSFPPGGTFVADAEGVMRGRHGWLTLLLPYVGREKLYEQIDFEFPYDDPVNGPAVATDVPEYFAAGGSRDPVGGFAVAHFAGVGGDLPSEAFGIVHAGVFGRNSAVTREDVVDGLSQTLIVGEVPSPYPPWSDPENWRTTGRGLNRDTFGFGNADGTGAMFLHADGSVRLYSNRTEPAVLERLSTRDGRETVDVGR